METAEQTRYRAIATGVNFLAQDRPELLYIAKEVCRYMGNPTVVAWGKLKRIVRYLVKHPRAVLKFKNQDLPYRIDTYCDSDWSACKRSRKSISGGVVMFGEHMIRAWSLTQAIIALRSGETEYYSLLKGASVSAGIQAICDDIDIYLDNVLHTDSAAAKGMARRKGAG